MTISFGDHLILTMDYFIKTFNIVRSLRHNEFRLPLQSLTFVHSDYRLIELVKKMEQYFLDELNTLNITYDTNETTYLDYSLSLNLKIAGKRFGKK
jgi:hypothetical protein